MRPQIVKDWPLALFMLPRFGKATILPCVQLAKLSLPPPLAPLERSENINFRAFGQRIFRGKTFSSVRNVFLKKIFRTEEKYQSCIPRNKCFFRTENEIGSPNIVKIPFGDFLSAEKIFFPYGIFFSKKSSIRKKIIKNVFRGTEVFAARKKNLLPSGKTFRALLLGYLGQDSADRPWWRLPCIS